MDMHFLNLRLQNNMTELSYVFCLKLQVNALPKPEIAITLLSELFEFVFTLLTHSLTIYVKNCINSSNQHC